MSDFEKYKETLPSKENCYSYLTDSNLFFDSKRSLTYK